MTWQLGALLILGLGLAGGFAWYERSRPDARIVALVATLAAFAALGRIAFAALPNVKPTTDIVLVSGYALGGAPGFVVGAVAGVTSNFFFGQGPWTPWQMAAWGATGTFGAGLAILTRGRIGRWPLALACCAVGFLFTVVQDVGDWVTYSDHSLAQLTTYVGTGLGFDAIDAAGCLGFALVFGPALLRSVQRFARRLQVRWIPPNPSATAVPVTIAVVASLALGLVPARARAAGTPASPLAYLLAAENRDGGFGPAPGEPSSALFSGWAALALAADGRNPAEVAHGGRSLLADVEATVPTDPGSLERTLLVAGAAGVPASDFGGHDLIAALDRDVRGNGSVEDQVDLTSFAVLGLRAVGATPPARMVGWLARQQDRDGGFSYAVAGDPPDIDDTGAVIEALAAAGADPTARARAVAFVRANQNRDGGFPSEPGGPSNAQSTAWAVQGLVAAGVDPATVRVHGSPSPQGYLQGLVTPSGAIAYARGETQTPVWVTAEAVLALDGKPFPLAAVPPATPSSPASAHPRDRSGVSGHSHPRAPAATSRHPHRRHRRGARSAVDHHRTTRRHRSSPRRERIATPAGTAPRRARSPRHASGRGAWPAIAIGIAAVALLAASGAVLAVRRRRRMRQAV